MELLKRVFLYSGLATLVVLLGMFSLYKWDSSVNRGREFGYWGDFNRMSNALSSIPGIAIKTSWCNADVTLEEFGFDITTHGLNGQLVFGERTPIRNMSRRRAIAALQERIARGLNLTNENGLWCTFEPI